MEAFTEAGAMRVRREWTRDYLETKGPDGRKTYIYTGDRHALTDEARRVYARRVTPLVALTLALISVIGLLDAPGSRVLYVALPWAGLTFATALALFDCVRILLTKRALTKRDYDSSALRLKNTLVWMLALSALAAACDVMYFLMNGSPVDEYLPIILSCLNLLFSISAYRLERGAVWNRIPAAPSDSGHPD